VIVELPAVGEAVSICVGKGVAVGPGVELFNAVAVAVMAGVGGVLVGAMAWVAVGVAEGNPGIGVIVWVGEEVGVANGTLVAVELGVELGKGATWPLLCKASR
jgi:hypothetical protein